MGILEEMMIGKLVLVVSELESPVEEVLSQAMSQWLQEVGKVGGVIQEKSDVLASLERIEVSAEFFSRVQ